MIFRGRSPEVAVWRRFRSSADGFVFARRDAIGDATSDAAGHMAVGMNTGVSSGLLYEAHVAANAERAVDLFYTLTQHLPPAVDVALEDRRAGQAWRGEDVALPDARDAIARMKLPLATYGGVEISVYSAGEQVTLTPRLGLYIYARSDRWLYLLLGNGLERHVDAAAIRRDQPWSPAPVPVLSDAAVAAAERLALRAVAEGGA